MMKNMALLLGTVWLMAVPSLSAQTTFHADSAYAYLQHLSVAIGPRPMGSHAEREALNWVVRQFRRFGATQAYVLPIRDFQRGGRAFRTQSGVAVGLFPGTTDSTIVIGSHLDSSGPEIPGANDNASGTACLVELARIWSQRDRHYTLLFAAFGGEEQGLIGSSYFVNHYDSLQNIILMLQIDMAGSDESITPFFEVSTHQAPAWLLRDAYAADRELGYRSLVYPTHFFSISNVLNAAGSDHQPFLHKGIPALDLTAGLNTSPIHTPRDRIEFIQPHMLERSGRLVDAMLQKYQRHGIPADRKGHYMLWQVAGILLFLPHWLLWTVCCVGLLLAAFAFLDSRKNRQPTDTAPRMRFFGFKILLLWIGVVIFSQLGEALMQWLTGYRHPWMTHIGAYVAYALLWALMGAWLALAISRTWRFSEEPHAYFKRPLIFYTLFLLLFSLQGPRLAAYPGAALLLIGLAYFVRQPVASALLGLFSIWPMARLIFSEAFPFYMHVWASGSYAIDSFGMAFLQSALTVLFLTFWFWPVPYTLIWLRFRHPSLAAAVQSFRKPATGIGLLSVLALGAILLYRLPAYNDQWRPGIRVLAGYEMSESKSRLRLVSNEFLRGVTLQADTLTRSYTETISVDEIDLPFSANWLQVLADTAAFSLSGDTLHAAWQIITEKPWYQVEMALRADTTFEVLEAQPVYMKRPRMLRFLWQFEPPETLTVRATLRLPPGITQLYHKVSAVYTEMPISIQVRSELHDVHYRTRVTRMDTIQLKRTLNQTGE